MERSSPCRPGRPGRPNGRLEAELEADRQLVGIVGPRHVGKSGRSVSTVRAVDTIGPRPFEAYAHARIEVVLEAEAVIEPGHLATTAGIDAGISCGERRVLGRLLVAQ